MTKKQFEAILVDASKSASELCTKYDKGSTKYYMGYLVGLIVGQCAIEFKTDNSKWFDIINNARKEVK